LLRLQDHPQYDIPPPRSVSPAHLLDHASRSGGGVLRERVSGGAESDAILSEQESLSVHLTQRREGAAAPGREAQPKVVYVRDAPRQDSPGDGAVAWEVEAVIPIPPLDPAYGYAATRDVAALEQVMAAVGEEASLASVKLTSTHVWLRGQPDQVQYGQDLVEAALHAA